MIYCKTHYPDLPILCLVYDQTHPQNLKCIGDRNAFSVLQRNNPCIFAVNIYNTQQKSDSLVALPLNFMSARSAF